MSTSILETCAELRPRTGHRMDYEVRVQVRFLLLHIWMVLYTVSIPLANFSSSKTFLTGFSVILKQWQDGPLEWIWKCMRGFFFHSHEWQRWHYLCWLWWQECDNLPKIYWAISHENAIAPSGVRVVHNTLSFKFTWNLIFPEIFLRPYYQNQLPLLCVPECLACLSQSTRVTQHWSLLFTCMPPLHICTNHTECSSRVGILSCSSLYLQCLAQCLTDNTQHIAHEWHAWEEQEEKGLQLGHDNSIGKGTWGKRKKKIIEKQGEEWLMAGA